jgi:hypothetical protein
VQRDARTIVGTNANKDLDVYILMCIIDLVPRTSPESGKRRMVSIYMDPDLVAGLELVRTRDGVPIAESARRAIRQWLNERKALSVTKRRNKAG